MLSLIAGKWGDYEAVLLQLTLRVVGDFSLLDVKLHALTVEILQNHGESSVVNMEGIWVL